MSLFSLFYFLHLSLNVEQDNYQNRGLKIEEKKATNHKGEDA